MRIHLIGIGGTGMGALAVLLKHAGHEVRGSDTSVYPPMSDQLAAAGIETMEGFSAGNLAWGPQRVVVGNVCSKDHVEVRAANQQNLPLESFPSMLENGLLPGRDPLVVAGTHGKTTTASLVAWLLEGAGRRPSFLIGGVPLNFGSGARLGEGRSIVLEGDEYDSAFFDKKSKFLHYRPKRAILTSVEYDHVDIFDDMDQVRSAFNEFVRTIDGDGDLVVNLADSEAMGVAAQASCRVHTYRVLPEGDDDVGAADYTARLRSGGSARRAVFEVFERGDSLGEFSTQLIGRYNLGNALAAVALARCEGAEPASLRDALRRFRGVKRRQELVGMASGVRIIEDFAHHPTAAALTVTAIRKRYPEKGLHVCFEPRSSSSRRAVFAGDYAAAFDAATRVYVAPVHAPEKVPEGELLDTKTLAKAISERGPTARAFADIEGLGSAVLEEAVPGDTVLCLSSGSFGGLPRRLLYGFGDPVTFAVPGDGAAVDELLHGYGLPKVAAAPNVETLVIRSPEGVVGGVSLQTEDECAFLFGLAVSPERRGEGLGWVLGDCVLRRARTLGVRVVYLITSTAADFFATKLGFSPLPSERVDPRIRNTENFRAWSDQENAVCMVFELPSDG